jgi:chaperonin GroES
VKPGAAAHAVTWAAATRNKMKERDQMNDQVHDELLTEMTPAPPVRHSYFEPLYDRVLVRRFTEDIQPQGGVIIPDAAKEQPLEGEVLAVGPGRRNEAGEFTPSGALLVKFGDHVLFGKYAGTEIKIDGEELLVMREEEILGVTERASDAKYKHPSVTALDDAIAELARVKPEVS